MKKIIALALLVACSTALAGQPDKDLHEKCIYPCVMTICPNPSNACIGSGVVVKSVKKDDKYINYVFTCAHVVPALPVIQDTDLTDDEKPVEPPKPKYEVLIRVGTYENWSTVVALRDYAATVMFTDRVADIALLRFETKDPMPVAEIDGDPELYIGNEVCRIGCGMGEPFRFDIGKITSVKESADRIIPAIRGTYRTSIPTISGDSGGPVYHENKLIGLAQAIRSNGSAPICHITYVLPMKRFLDCQEIVDFLKD